VKLSFARECYFNHSSSASSSARQAAFGGIAVVWLFNHPSAQAPIVLAPPLVIALLLLSATLLLDLLQYSVSAAIWGFYGRLVEKRLAHRFHDDPDISPPPQLNWPGLACFWFKLSSLAAAYCVLLIFLWRYL
jgi:hypothetical protein